MPVPHEISFGWVYFPPLAFVILFGIVLVLERLLLPWYYTEARSEGWEEIPTR